MNKDVCRHLQTEINKAVSTYTQTVKPKLLYWGLKLPVSPLLTIPSSPWLHVLLRTRNVQLGGLLVALSKSLLKFFSGTGTNAAYVEAANNVENLGKMPGSATLVAINTEWGAFGERNELEVIRT